MSQTNLEHFLNEVAESEELQSCIGEEITGEDLVALGADHDWEFTTDELLAAAELSDEELDAVAGGGENARPHVRRAGSGLAMRGGRFRFDAGRWRGPNTPKTTYDCQDLSNNESS